MLFSKTRLARCPAWQPYTQGDALCSGAQGLRLPHPFQKYVGLDTSAFRYAVRSAVRGKRTLSLSSPSWLDRPFLLQPPHPYPASSDLPPSLEPGPAGLGAVTCPLSKADPGPGGVVRGEGPEHHII